MAQEQEIILNLTKQEFIAIETAIDQMAINGNTPFIIDGKQVGRCGIIYGNLKDKLADVYANLQKEKK